MRNYYLVVFSTFTQSTANTTFSTYWQQQVDYTMDIQMDVEKNQYTGKQKLVYTNNSPESLQKVFYHLYFNAFQPNSEMDARVQSVIDPDSRMLRNIGTKENHIVKSKISQLQPDEIGFIKVLSLKQNGVPISYEIEGTGLEVRLNKLIASGEQVTFDMEFLGQVPNMVRRGGRNNKGGVALSMVQWYPKMAVYDFEGWHADLYIHKEFYGEWGDSSEPSAEIQFYCPQSGKTSITIESEDGKELQLINIEAVKGMNVYDYNLTISRKGVKNLEKAEVSLIKGANDKNYLPKGKYHVGVNNSSKFAKTVIAIK